MFNSISSKKVYEQVIEQIQENILNGEFKKGDKLPSERELSEQMSVSRTSIREALRVLETMGVVESRQGEGNFICENIEKSLIEPLSMIFKLNNGEWKDVLELREILEIQAVKIAADRITEEEAKDLKSIIKQMEEEINGENDNKNLVLLDQKFHNKLAEISKNCLIESIFMTSSKLFEEFIENARGKIISIYSNEEILFTQHKAICDAIVNKECDLACKKMKEHMELIWSNYEQMK